MDPPVDIRALAVKEFSLDVQTLDPQASLASLGVDSLALMEFVFKVEDTFGVQLSDQDLRGLGCLADLERRVAAMVQDAGGT